MLFLQENNKILRYWFLVYKKKKTNNLILNRNKILKNKQLNT